MENQPNCSAHSLSRPKTLVQERQKQQSLDSDMQENFYRSCWVVLSAFIIRQVMYYLINYSFLIVSKNMTCSLINFNLVVSKFVNVLQQCRFEGDLRLSISIYVAIEKVLVILDEKWWYYVNDRNELRPDLVSF